MSLLPQNESELLDDYLLRVSDDELEQPGKTYSLNFNDGRIGGMIDDKQAVLQFINKAIVTERGHWRIYTDDYGCELYSLIGTDVTEGFLQSEIPRMISEAIEFDERIISVNSVDSSREGDKVFIHADVTTIYGDVDARAVI